MSKYPSHLPYNPEKLQRELKKFYISASDDEIQEMLKELGLNSLDDLFKHLPEEIKFDEAPDLGPDLEYGALVEHLEGLANKNTPKTTFIGDGLKNYKVQPIVPFVSDLRGLTTAYTPYQPERSQGTLNTLWVYSSTLSMLTGFEAINASMYDRSTSLFESLQTAIRIQRKKTKVLVSETFFPNDLEVLKTHAKGTHLEYILVPTCQDSGRINIEALKELLKSHGDSLAGFAFPQINCFGNLEDVHTLTNLAQESGLLVIADIDPMTLATEGLIPPSDYGEVGADIIIGEGQHLAIGPNFGGPGLGIFGIRYNPKNKTNIRSTPGRYIGKTKDLEGNDCLCMVLSTREQHIRREKATSNICSNQSFLASLVGASILNRGEKGMTHSCKTARVNAVKALKMLTNFEGINLAFPSTPFFNEFTLELPVNPNELIQKARKKDLHLGVDISSRLEGDKNLLLVSLFDIHEEKDLIKLKDFFSFEFNEKIKNIEIPEIPSNFMRTTQAGLPNFTLDELKEFYTKLSDQNVSPDDSIYPLGSCTMKYNPYINDYAAGLPGFTDLHPEAPLEDAQGSLEILYETQEIFKSMTGLQGVTTQPVAGAQGELVGIKMFQAYHRDNGEGETRNIILIPTTAHGTNPATATMAGFDTKVVDGKKMGIVLLNALANGQMDMDHLETLITEYGQRISGIMVTNPNTSGIFENKFHIMAKKIHAIGGLVYMDGANMNAIASWVNLGSLGVDAVHNNLHKTWTIPHGGGGPGDAIVAVSEKLVDYMPGIQVEKNEGIFKTFVPKKSIGSFHRHYGNFAHKVRCYSYLKALGTDGVRKMSAVAVLCARYLFEKLKTTYPTLPYNTEDEPRMHEFIITLETELFSKIDQAGTPKAQTMAKIGKLFLDFGLHAPTVAFPEIYGLMIEPTESFTKAELDRFVDVVKSIHTILLEHPEVLKTAPHFTPVRKVDEVGANKNLQLSERLTTLGKIPNNRIPPKELEKMSVGDIMEKILEASKL